MAESPWSTGLQRIFFSIRSRSFQCLVVVVLPIVFVTFFPRACMAKKFAEYPTRQVSDCLVSGEKAGLKIGLQAMDDPKEEETYFHTNMRAKGLVPLFVVMQNSRTEGSFLFEKAKITFGSATSTTSGPQVHSTSGTVMAVVGAGGVLGIIGGVKVVHASEVQENLLKNELQSKTISPGSLLHGFLYVKIPNGSPREGIHISIPFTDMSTNETITFDLTF